MKKIASILVLAVAFGGSAWAQDEEAATDATGVENLEKVDGAFKETWVNPDIDFAKYKNLYLWEATFEYRDVGPARRTRMTMMSTHKREFGILDSDREKFENVVSEVFISEIEKLKNLPLADEIGPDTLILRGSVLDIISRVPPESIGMSEIYVATVGEATLVLELIDAESGNVIAVAAERQAISPAGGRRIDQFSMPANSVTVFANVRRWARRAAGNLREELDAATQ